MKRLFHRKGWRCCASDRQGLIIGIGMTVEPSQFDPDPDPEESQQPCFGGASDQ
jgi:hypothetical protein